MEETIQYVIQLTSSMHMIVANMILKKCSGMRKWYKLVEEFKVWGILVYRRRKLDSLDSLETLKHASLDRAMLLCW